MKKPTYESVWKEYQKGLSFNTQLGLDETVKKNEDFFIGNQWLDVVTNGLPTPVFNFLKRVVLFTVANIASDNIKMDTKIIGERAGDENLENVTTILNKEFDVLFEQNKIVNMLREFLRNTAVDGDACTYTRWDPDIKNGYKDSGAIVTEIIENTRVFFGNPNDRRVQKQPFILLTRRELTEELRERAENNPYLDDITSDDDDNKTLSAYKRTDDKTTVLTRLWRNKDTGTIWCMESTAKLVITEPYDTGLTLYPVTWLCWDFIQDSYHGQAMLTGLIPNQIFVNKAYAMSMLSLMTTAFPKVIYDKTRITKWDNRVGQAIPVNGGDMTAIAKIMDPAQISPQISQFIQMAEEDTKSNLGATSVALGDTRPDNTSAIIALQRAAATPNELTKQNLYESLEEWGRICIDMMCNHYGTRRVFVDMPEGFEPVAQAAGVKPGSQVPVDFDFSTLRDLHLSIKLDVGASAYWSETASMQTMDNLLMQNRPEFTVLDYLERVPNGYISKQQSLINKIKATQGMTPNCAVDGAMGPGDSGQGYAPSDPSTPSGALRHLPQGGG